MSKLRDRAAEVKAAGEASRGNYRPEGKPLQVYTNYYRQPEAGIPPVRENFCHFYRIVLLWAPLLWLRQKTRPVTRVLGAPFRGLGSLTKGRGLMIALGILAVCAVVLVVMFTILAIQALMKIGWAQFLLDALVMVGVVVGVFVLAVLAILAIERAGNFLGMRRQLKKDREREAEVKYFAEHHRYPEPEEKQPGAVTSFFKAIGDFLVLISQVARVNKWKICPLVDIEDERVL